MSDPKAKSPERPDRGASFDKARVTPLGVHSHDDSPARPRESLEALLQIPLPEAMVEDAAGLARTAAAAARTAAAGLPPDARDPTGFLAVLESLAPERGASNVARVTPVGVHSHDDSPARPDAAKDGGDG